MIGKDHFSILAKYARCFKDARFNLNHVIHIVSENCTQVFETLDEGDECA